MAFANSAGAYIHGAATYPAPLTLFIRAKTSNNTALQGAICFNKHTEAETRHTVFFRGERTSPNKSVSSFRQLTTSSHFSNDGLGADYAINVWHAVAGRHEQPSSSYNAVALDDSAYTAFVIDSLGSLGLTRVHLGADVDQTTLTYPLVGSYCCAAVYDAKLTAEEHVSLFKGFSPRRIRPQNLIWYAPCIRDMNEIRRSNALTDTGSKTVENHPRSYGL